MLSSSETAADDDIATRLRAARDGRVAATHPFVRKKYPDRQHQFAVGCVLEHPRQQLAQECKTRNTGGKSQ